MFQSQSAHVNMHSLGSGVVINTPDPVGYPVMLQYCVVAPLSFPLDTHLLRGSVFPAKIDTGELETYRHP